MGPWEISLIKFLVKYWFIYLVVVLFINSFSSVALKFVSQTTGNSSNSSHDYPTIRDCCLDEWSANDSSISADNFSSVSAGNASDNGTDTSPVDDLIFTSFVSALLGVLILATITGKIIFFAKINKQM